MAGRYNGLSPGGGWRVIFSGAARLDWSDVLLAPPQHAIHKLRIILMRPRAELSCSRSIIPCSGAASGAHRNCSALHALKANLVIYFLILVQIFLY